MWSFICECHLTSIWWWEATGLSKDHVLAAVLARSSAPNTGRVRYYNETAIKYSGSGRSRTKRIKLKHETGEHLYSDCGRECGRNDNNCAILSGHKWFHFFATSWRVQCITIHALNAVLRSFVDWAVDGTGLALCNNGQGEPTTSTSAEWVCLVCLCVCIEALSVACVKGWVISITADQVARYRVNWRSDQITQEVIWLSDIRVLYSFRVTRLWSGCCYSTIVSYHSIRWRHLFGQKRRRYLTK